MTAQIIDGKAVAKQIKESLSTEAAAVTARLGRRPCLAVVLVGDDPGSKVYVSSKTKTAEAIGVDHLDTFLPATTSNAQLQKTLREIDARPEVDGILLQLPLPAGLDECSALQCISPEKDADGLSPANQGRLLRGAPCPRPCTPNGVMVLIDQARENLGLPKDMSGLHACVVGRSILVGKPLALMLLERHCTVTMCHSRTKDLAEECRRADILVAAVGKLHLITAEFVKPGAIVIDVGMNRMADGGLAGDVDFAAAKELAAAITPVPGGVGPMTIAMLMSNTVEAAKKKAFGIIG